MKKLGIIIAAVFMMMVVVFFPSIDSLAASCGETVSQNTAATLKSVDYDTDATVAALLAPSRYSMADKLNKKMEISKRDGRNIADISDDEAVRELNWDNLQVTSFREVFIEVQGEIERIIQRIVDGDANAQNKGETFLTEKILQNKEKLLLGLAYVGRLYDFNMGDKNIKDVILYEPGAYGVQTDILDWLIKIGSAGGDTLKVSNSANLFGWGKLFSYITSSMTLGAFLEENRQKWISDIPMEEWFIQAGHAFIVEEQSSWNNAKEAGLYNRLYNDTLFRSYILPLLTVSEDSIYVIANSATITFGIVDCYVDRNLKDTDPALYREKQEEFRQQLEQAARQQREFIDLWYRIAQPEKRGLLSTNRIVMDSLRIYSYTSDSASQEWSAKFGKDASIGVKEFFTPLNLYGSFMFSDGMADGSGVRYYLSKALTERGLATYAHELTHLLVSSLILNGYGARDGMQAEVYTRGMFEPYELNDPPVFNLNLIYDRLTNNERLHNAQPGRFQDEADMQEYMSGILDVVYTLDYTEADIMLSKTPEEKKKWFHKLEQVEDTKKRPNPGDEGSKHYLDSVRELTLEEAEQLNTIDDLIRDSIIVSRYEVNGTQTTGTMASNGYYVVPLFSANYAGVQNDAGVSGDVMIRRQAFELLAEYGYYNGMIPYISNQYKQAAQSEQTILSDTYVLNKIFGGTYGTMAEFKKAMFQKRIEKAGELKPVTIRWKDQSVTVKNFDALRQLMKEAVESDLKNVNPLPGGSNNIRAQATQVELLKAEIFRAYLFQTEDFKESIYGAGEEPTPTESPEQSPLPSVSPTAAPTVTPSGMPLETPPASPEPTEQPGQSPVPSVLPTLKPTGTPATEPPASPEPTEQPGQSPVPSVLPTLKPTGTPATEPPASLAPTEQPGQSPVPSVLPTLKPTGTPATEPPASPPEQTELPTQAPTELPTEVPPESPAPPKVPAESAKPLESRSASPVPTELPTEIPSMRPTDAPDGKPSAQPSTIPSTAPDDPGSVLPGETDFHPGEESGVTPNLFFAKVSSSKALQVIRWDSVKSADGYYIYGAKSNAKYKRLRMVNKKARRWKRTKLKRGTQYKYYVAAYKRIGGKRVIICKSLPVYSTTRGGKYGDPVKIKVKRRLVSVKCKKRARLGVRVTGRKLKKAERKVRYIASDPSIAKVSKKGTVTGVRSGTCYIYCVARNGLYKKVKIRVK